jgi:dolichol-phosphate mannosyltransferase
MNHLLIAIATYNEIENLPRLVSGIFHHLPQAQVLVVDDNSPDGTGRWCQAAARDDDRLHCLVRLGKLGLGTAAVETIRYALTHDYDLLIHMDADLSHDPRYLEPLIAAMTDDDGKPVDVAIGSRYVAGGGVQGWPWYRRWMSRLVNHYARSALGLTCHDCSGSFRCYRVTCLRRLNVDAIRSRGYSFYEEILWWIQRAGGRFVEVPIVFTDRRHGRSKINLREAIAAARIIAALGRRSRQGETPPNHE